MQKKLLCMLKKDAEVYYVMFKVKNDTSVIVFKNLIDSHVIEICFKIGIKSFWTFKELCGILSKIGTLNLNEIFM